MIVSCAKLILLAALAIVTCQAKCFSDDPFSCGPADAELEAADKVNSIPKPIQSIVPTDELVSSKTDACDCTASPTGETPKLGVVMKEVGNKYRVFTITIPMGTDAVETPTAESKSENVSTAESKSENVSTAEFKVENVSTDEEPTSPKDIAEPESVDDVKLEEVEAEEKEEPKIREKAKKEKVKEEKKKYKRDVGKKSAGKKSTQRKNKDKGQGKKKSKK